MSEYAKTIVAVIGAGITTLLALIPADTTLWTALTVASAMLTAAAVYFVPNAPATTQRPAGDVSGRPYG